MVKKEKDFPSLIKEVRKQLGISQESIAREIGISFATVNRWENGKAIPSNLAKAQFDSFCSKMVRQGKLKISGDQE